MVTPIDYKLQIKLQKLMYSSSPQVIKHFVPMNFSKMTLDLKTSPRKSVNNIMPIQQNPLTNFKLQQLNQKPKDFVLIFKNKSMKDFMPRKKINISPKIKMMKRSKSSHYGTAPDNIINIQNQSDPKVFKKSHQSIHQSLLKLKFSGFDIDRLTSQRQTKTSSTVRRTIGKAYNTIRQRDSKSCKRARKDSFDRYEALFKQPEQKSVKCLRISGSKAPNSEMVDHFKRFSMETTQNYIFDKLVR